MRLVDFVSLLLKAQGHTLQRLAALLGEDILIEVLELAGERQVEVEKAHTEQPVIPLRKIQKLASESFAYGEIQDAVNELRLSPMIEFYLWSYPPYRRIIESSVDLNAMIESSGDEFNEFVEASVSQAKDWIRGLHLPPEIGPQAEAAANVPWNQFRVKALTKAGKKPFNAIR